MYNIVKLKENEYTVREVRKSPYDGSLEISAEPLVLTSLSHAGLMYLLDRLKRDASTFPVRDITEYSLYHTTPRYEDSDVLPSLDVLYEDVDPEELLKEVTA